MKFFFALEYTATRASVPSHHCIFESWTEQQAPLTARIGSSRPRGISPFISGSGARDDWYSGDGSCGAHPALYVQPPLQPPDRGRGATAVLARAPAGRPAT